MAFERGDQKFFIGGKNPTFWTNFFLFLITIGIIVIILLMLFCPRWGCWRGTKVVGTDGRIYDGGGVYINACCEGTPRTPGCPECPPCNGDNCEEQCRQYSNYPERYKECMNECNPPQSCEENCRQYSNYPERYKECMNECNPQYTCQDRCKNSPTTTYEACMRECYPTCPEYCRAMYANDPTAMTTCFNQCAPTTPLQPITECRDSDGKNINTAGEVHLGDKVYKDSCYDTTHVIEWICRGQTPSELRITCPGRCLNGACVETQTTTTPQTYVATAYS